MSKQPVKKLNFFQKFWLTFKLLKINPLISYCHYCHSFNLGKADSEENENEYCGTYWCKKCGATMVLVEKWAKRE